MSEIAQPFNGDDINGLFIWTMGISLRAPNQAVNVSDSSSKKLSYYSWCTRLKKNKRASKVYLITEAWRTSAAVSRFTKCVIIRLKKNPHITQPIHSAECWVQRLTLGMIMSILSCVHCSPDSSVVVSLIDTATTKTHTRRTYCLRFAKIFVWVAGFVILMPMLWLAAFFLYPISWWLFKISLSEAMDCGSAAFSFWLDVGDPSNAYATAKS